MPSILTKRQYGWGYDPNDYEYYSWWYSPAGIAVKYSLWALFIIALLAYFIGGRVHAQRRMRKGLAPLAYHKWLVSRRQRARFDPQPVQPQSTYQYMYGSGPAYGQQTYGMTDYAVPPPAYNHDVPPTYQPPPGASKVDPQQVHVTELNNGGSGSSSAVHNGGLAAPGAIYNPAMPAAGR